MQLSIYTYFIKFQIYFFGNGIVYRPSTIIKKKLIFLNISNYNYKNPKINLLYEAKSISSGNSVMLTSNRS